MAFPSYFPSYTRMIAEPYICTKSSRAGEIQWFNSIDPRYVDPRGEYHCEGVPWRVYADFEREKLKTLSKDNPKWIIGMGLDLVPENRGYILPLLHHWYDSKGIIGADGEDLYDASESTRLLKRAEFLKAVCEKEGVEWLPKQKAPESSYLKTGESIEANFTVKGVPFTITISTDTVPEA